MDAESLVMYDESDKISVREIGEVEKQERDQGVSGELLWFLSSFLLC